MANERRNAGAEVGPGRGGLTRVLLFHPEGGSAEIYDHGGQLLSWRHPSAGDVLFLSSRSDRRQESHGGIPVLFPRFGKDPEGTLPQHGFARNLEWAIGEPRIDQKGRSTAAMTLAATPETRAQWPHDFRLEIEIALGETLTMTLRATNPGPDPFVFTAGLHSYLRVRDVRRTRIRGLGGVSFQDKLADSAERMEGEPLTIDRETDRIYLASPSPIVVADGERELRVENRGWANVVLWNPGPAGDTRYDFAPGEWAQFVCVEGVTVLDPITLRPGESWSASQTLSVRDGAINDGER